MFNVGIIMACKSINSACSTVRLSSTCQFSTFVCKMGSGLLLAPTIFNVFPGWGSGKTRSRMSRSRQCQSTSLVTNGTCMNLGESGRQTHKMAPSMGYILDRSLINLTLLSFITERSSGLCILFSGVKRLLAC